MTGILQTLRWLVLKTLPAGSLMGIPLRIHLLMAIVMPLFALSMARSYSVMLGVVGALLFAAMYLGVLYVSILAHEFGHAWGMRLVGGRTDMIILTPVGGLAVGTGSDISPRAELIVVVPGPVVSILLAIGGWLAGVGLGLVPTFENQTAAMAMYWATIVAMLFFHLNLMLAMFNLLFPLFPMDSARIIRAALSLRLNPQLVTLRLCQLGVGLGIALFLAFFFNVRLPVIGPVGLFLVVIGMLGVQACLYEQERIRQMTAYAQQDTWGAKTVFYDNDTVRIAKARASEDLWFLMRPWKWLRRRTGAGRTKTVRSARVIEVVPQIPPEEVDDLAQLEKMMRSAAENEDFPLAGRIQRRIREVKNRPASSE